MSDNTDLFNIANIEFNSEIYGPGVRSVVWFQGCTLGCKGCWNTNMQSNVPHTLLKKEQLRDLLIECGNPVTFLGGEPLQQLANLMWLIDELKTHAIHMMLYTGYELSEIEEDPEKKRLCESVDILIPGRYRDELRDTGLAWRGSRNQPIIANDDFEKPPDANQVEVIIGPDGSITCLGYPDKGMVQLLESFDFLLFNS